MARPIEHDSSVRDPRAELIAKLESAPAAHAEALLSAYQVLQGLHDRGVLDVVRGALGSSDKLVEIGLSVANAPGAERAVRNLLQLVNALGAIDPEVLGRFTRALPPALEAAARPTDPPGLLWLLMQLRDKEARQGLAAAQALLAALGHALQAPSPGEQAGAHSPRTNA